MSCQTLSRCHKFAVMYLPVRLFRLRRLIILASASALFKLVSNQIDLFYGTKSNDACQVLGYAAVSGYGGSLCFVYFGLWLRQASLQSLNALCHLPRKKIRLACSWALLVVMVVAFAVLFFLNFVTMALSASPYGCIFSDIGKVSQSARSSAGLVFTFVFQPAFAALLLYPLLKKMPSQRRKTIRSETAYKNAMRVYRLIKRCLITLLIITVSDIGTIIASFKLETSPVIVLAMVYDLNAFIGIASLLFSFADWRKRLGFRTNRNDSNQPTSASSS